MTNQTADLSTMSGLELLRTMMPMLNNVPNIGRTIGMEVETLEDGKVEFALTSKPDHANPLGSVHGGVCATLLDSVMGCAVHTTLAAGIGYSTLELKVNYIRTVPTDGVRLIGTGTVIHRGRTTATAEGKVHDEQGRLVAHGTTTCLIYS